MLLCVWRLWWVLSLGRGVGPLLAIRLSWLGQWRLHRLRVRTLKHVMLMLVLVLRLLLHWHLRLRRTPRTAMSTSARRMSF